MSIVGEYIVENVFVVSVEVNGLKVIPESSCTVSSGCTNCSRCSNTDKKNIIFYKFNDISKVSVGDVIKLKFYKFNQVFAAIIMFILPLIFAVLTQIVLSLKGINPDSTFAIVITLLSFVFGFVVAFALETAVKKIKKSSILRV